MCVLELLMSLSSFFLKVIVSSDRRSLPSSEILAKDPETSEAMYSLLAQITNSVLVHGRNEYATY